MKAKIQIILNEGETYKSLAAMCRNMENAICPNVLLAECPLGKPCEKVRATDWKHIVEDGFSVEGSVE